jgi:predicted amidohydrolase
MSREEVERIVDWYIDLEVTLLRKAAGRGARIACLPECAVDVGKWLRTVGEPLRGEVARQTWDKNLAALCDVAREEQLVIVGGCPEPDPDAGRYYNSAPVIDKDGRHLGSYRKVQLTDGECEWLTRGSELPVFETEYGRLGVFICWDVMFPEVTQTLACQGADLLLQPTYGHSGPQADAMAMTRAHDAVCPLVVAMWNGASRIFDKDGRLLARAHRTRDADGIIPHQIVMAEADPTAPRQWLDAGNLREMFRAQRQHHAYEPMWRERELRSEEGAGD